MAKDFTTLLRVNQPHFPHQHSRPIGPEPFQCKAGAAGFEPANPGVKVQSLTTWGRPNILGSILVIMIKSHIQNKLLCEPIIFIYLFFFSNFSYNTYVYLRALMHLISSLPQV